MSVEVPPADSPVLPLVFRPNQLRELSLIFDEINQRHFDGFLDPPTLRWNSRLRASAGRFIPGRRSVWGHQSPIIEIASYLVEEASAEALIRDTMGHEMIHYWLWARRRPYGHTSEFMTKMKLMGVSRYNPVPRVRAYRYVYRCVACLTEFFAKRRLGTLACAKCCRTHAGGKFDRRFLLVFDRPYDGARSGEALELPCQEA